MEKSPNAQSAKATRLKIINPCSMTILGIGFTCTFKGTNHLLLWWQISVKKRTELQVVQIFSICVNLPKPNMEHFIQGKFPLGNLFKCQTSIHVLPVICFQWSKWFGPKLWRWSGDSCIKILENEILKKYYYKLGLKGKTKILRWIRNTKLKCDFGITKML